MNKQRTHTMNISSVTVKALHYFSANNASRQTIHAGSTSTQGLIASLADRGYDPTKVVEAYKLTEDESKQGKHERQKRLDELKANKETVTVTRLNEAGQLEKVTLSPSDILRTYQTMYVKNGKVVTPTYGGVTGYHRDHVLVVVNALRFMSQEPLIEAIPCLVKVYANKAERDLACIAENTQGMQQGVNKLSSGDYMTAALNLYRSGSIEGKFRKIFKGGMGQKLFAICTLNNEFKTAKIAEGILSGDVDFPRIDKERARKASKAMDEFSDDTIIAAITKPRSNEKPIMKKADIAAIRKQNGTIAVEMVCDAILKNDSSLIKPITDRQELLNAVMDAHIDHCKRCLDILAQDTLTK